MPHKGSTLSTASRSTDGSYRHKVPAQEPPRAPPPFSHSVSRSGNPNGRLGGAIRTRPPQASQANETFSSCSPRSTFPFAFVQICTPFSLTCAPLLVLWLYSPWMTYPMPFTSLSPFGPLEFLDPFVYALPSPSCAYLRLSASSRRLTDHSIINRARM